MSWRFRRQLAIVILILTFVGTIFGLWYWWNLPDPTCFDGKQNGNELGVDCGGECARVCSVEVRDIRLNWAKVFEVVPGTYSVVGVFENPNTNFASTDARYRISYVSSGGEIIEEREEETFINPNDTFAIFSGNFNAEPGLVKQVFIDFYDINWQRNNENENPVTVTRRNLELDDTPLLEARVTNNASYDLNNFRVIAVLSDENGNAFTSSATLVDSLRSGESQNIFFTWRRPFSKNPTFIDFYPRISVYDTP